MRIRSSKDRDFSMAGFVTVVLLCEFCPSSRFGILSSSGVCICSLQGEYRGSFGSEVSILLRVFGGVAALLSGE